MKIAAILSVIAAAGCVAAGPKFLPAGECALCHTRIPPPGQSWNSESSSEWIGPYALWSGSMMAHASSDPYWRAKILFESEQPSADRSAIEDFCLRCHAPAQQYSSRIRGERLSLDALDDGGRDGVTCTVCHQITPASLGREASFTAGFTISLDRLLFGPHHRPFAMPMLRHTGFRPEEARHILESALCGACHTVIIPSGRTALVEQGPFLEWLASAYPGRGRTCQDCHMLQLRQAQYIAHRPPGGPFPPTEPRQPFGRHEFIGGNAVGLAALGRSLSAQRATARLKESLELAVTTARTSGRTVSAVVEARNHAGHKLPTGFPSRRLWLHFSVLDGRGRVLFESGDWDPASNELRCGEAVQPHRATIGRATEVQVFEVESDSRSLMRATRHIKDNRILPAGFDSKRLETAGLAHLEIATGFTPGLARTHYQVTVAEGAVPRRVRVEAVFQAIKPSHLPAAAAALRPLTGPIVIAAVEAQL
jgi:hypothetical protein